MFSSNQDPSEVMAALTAEDPQAVRAAAQWLGAAGDAEALPGLIYALGNKHRGCQEAVKDALVQIGGDRTVANILPLLADRNPQRSAAAAEILERIGRCAIAPVIALLQHEDPRVRGAAATLLGKLGAREAIPHLMALRTDENINVRSTIFRVLGELGDAAVCDGIRAHVRDPEAWVRFAVMHTLAELQDHQAIPLFLEDLRSSDDLSAWAAVEALGRLGVPEVVPPLLKMLAPAPASLRDHIVCNIVRIAEAQDFNLYLAYGLRRHEGAFLSALSNPKSKIKEAAVLGLGRFGGHRAVAPMLACLEAVPFGCDARLEPVVEEALCRIGETEPLLAYLQAVSTPVPRNKERTIQVCGRVLGRLQEPKAIDVLVALLASDSVDVRRTLVNTLGELGDRRTCDALMGRLRDGTGHVRGEAARALGRIGDPCAALPLFEALLRERYADVKQALIRALVSLGDARIKERCRALLFHPATETRQLAIQCFGAMADWKDGRLLFENLQDEHHGIRRQVVEILGRLDDPNALEPLIYALTDEHEAVRMAAVEALAHKPSEQAVRGLISSLYDPNKRVAYKAAEALGSLGDASCVQPMLNLLRCTEDVPMKIALVRFLQQVPDARVKHVLEEIRRDPNPDLQKLFCPPRG